MISNGVAIWGIGQDGLGLYYKIKCAIKVVCFIDTHFQGKQIDGLETLSFEEYDAKYGDKNVTILIGTRKYQQEIIHVLGANNYRLGEDYLTYPLFGGMEKPFSSINYYYLRERMCELEAINYIEEICSVSQKKLAIFYGNCQMWPLYSYLLCNSLFKDDYFVLVLPQVHQYKSIKALSILEESFWGMCELFVGQRVSAENKFNSKLASELVESRLSPKVKCIWVPYVFFEGYYPQCENYDKRTHPHNSEDFFFYGDKYIDQMKMEGKEDSLILKNISDEDFIDSDSILKLCNQSIQELKRREMRCSIKMSDYLEEKFRTRQLFFCPAHPIPDVMIEEAKRVLSYIGYVDVTMIIEDKDQYSLKGMDVPIYPCVIKALGLNLEEESYMPNKYCWEFEGGFYEYEKKYIETYWK